MRYYYTTQRKQFLPLQKGKNNSWKSQNSQGQSKGFEAHLLSMRGQVDERVRFYANTFDGTVFVALNGEIVYVLPKYEIAMKETLVGVKTVEIKGEDDAGTMIKLF